MEQVVPLGEAPEGLEAGRGDGHAAAMQSGFEGDSTWDLDEVVSHPIGRLAALGGPARRLGDGERPLGAERMVVPACPEVTLSIGRGALGRAFGLGQYLSR